MTAVLAAALGGVLWYRGGVVLAAAGSLITVVLCLGSFVGWVRRKLPKAKPLSRGHAVALLSGGVAAVLVALLLPASAFDRGARPDPPPPGPTGSPTDTAPTDTAAPAPTDPASPTADAALARYCDLALEFLGHAQAFSGKGWQGKITRRDFDPIVRTADAALEVAPAEMRAPMTVLASSYKAAQDGWSDKDEDILKNGGLAIGTILSPSARAAADAVDSYENEHCF